MINFDDLFDTIQVLHIEPSDPALKEACGAFLKDKEKRFSMVSATESVMTDPDVMMLENFDIIAITALTGCSEEYMQALNWFCTKYSFLPIVIMIDHYSEESVLSYLSLGVQDVIDITQSKEAGSQFGIKILSSMSRQLKARISSDSDDLYRSLFDYGMDIVFLVSEQGDLLYASPNVETLIGQGVSELVGSSFCRLLGSETCVVLQPVFNLGDSGYGKVYRTKGVLLTSDGGEKAADIIVRNRVDDSKVGCMVVNCHIGLETGALEIEELK
ncbi:MAG: PAS domain-containing protein [Fibrobacterales bacterium]